MVRCVFIEPGLDSVEQIPIQNRRLLAFEDLTFEDHLSDVEAITKQMGERPACEWNAANRFPALQGSNPSDDPTFAQVGHQQVEAAKLEIAAEDTPDPLSLSFIDGYLPILRVVTQRDHAADPEALTFRGGDLVPDALG